MDVNTAGLLYALIQRHEAVTGSARAREVLVRWERYCLLFWKVVPQPVVEKPPREVPAPEVAEDAVYAPAQP